MSTELFGYTNYKLFLNEKLDELDGTGRGSRARLSRAIGCQTAYTAQVLRGAANFSLEQAELINDFLGHTEDQGHYFLLLVQVAKAGTPKLRERFQKQIDVLLESRSILKNRLGVKENLAKKEQIIYYSSWIYGAIHALVSVPGFQAPEKIAARLQIGLKTAVSALEFLTQSGLLEKGKNGELKVGKGQIHLGSDSPLITKHHINWRLQAVRALENPLDSDLHYSSVVSLSKKDMAAIKERLIEAIQRIKPVIRASKEEDVCSLSIDFFRI